MQVINKITRRFFELPTAAKLFSTFLILALVFSSLFVVSLYSPVITDKDSDAYLQTLSKEELIGMIEAEKTKTSIALMNKDMFERDSSHYNSEFTKEIRKSKKLEHELSKVKRKLKKQTNLEYFTCGTSQGGAPDKKDLINACISVLKVMLAENYQSTGRFPKNLSSLGYSSDLHQNEVISKINFRPQGEMVLFLKPQFGKEKTIRLSFEDSDGLAFNCKSNLADKILSKKHCGNY